MSSWTFYLQQENNEKLSVPVQFTLFLNFIVDAPSLSLSAQSSARPGHNVSRRMMENVA